MPHQRACHAEADTSVSEATWSMTARRRTPSSEAAHHCAANTGSRAFAPAS